MGGLPSVPNLDPNSPQGAGESDPPAPTAEAAAQKTDASPLPSPAPSGANVAPEPAVAPAADPGAPIPKPGSAPSEAAPKPVPAPGAPPVNQSPESEVGPVQDSVEEVLQQSADQALRLSHLEDILTALNQTLTDIRDEMHAGFA